MGLACLVPAAQMYVKGEVVDKFADFVIQHLESGNQIEPYLNENENAVIYFFIFSLLPKCKAAPKQVRHAQRSTFTHFKKHSR